MKRILFMASDNSIASGAFKSMAKLCRLIKDSGKYEPIVIVPNEGDGVTLLDEYGIEHYYVRSCRWIIGIKEKNSLKTKLRTAVKKTINFFSYPKLLHLVKSLNVNLIHINTLHCYIGAKVAKKLGLPLVWHFRELLDEDQEAWFWDDSYKTLLNSADWCIAISEYVFNRFKDIVQGGKLVMIPNGIDASEYYTMRTFHEDDVLHFICVGNMDGHKGQDKIIRACKRLIERHITQFHLDFVGGGLKEVEYRQMTADLCLDDYISFNGKSKNVDQYYQKADVMLMSSKAEAFGRTTVEAMMCGCAVIGANSGATPGLLEHGEYGFLFESGSYSQLSDIMEELIGDHEKMFMMAVKGQRYALETYTAQKNADSVMKVYERVIGVAE